MYIPQARNAKRLMSCYISNLLTPSQNPFTRFTWVGGRRERADIYYIYFKVTINLLCSFYEYLSVCGSKACRGGNARIEVVIFISFVYLEHLG